MPGLLIKDIPLGGNKIVAGKRGRWIMWFFLLAVAFVYLVSSHADDLPERPIRMIITYSVGERMF